MGTDLHHTRFERTSRRQLVVVLVLSIPALARLTLPDIGAETVPGPVLFWLDRWWGCWLIVALAFLLLGVGRALRGLPLLRDAAEPGLLGIMLDIGLGLWALCTGCVALASVNLFHGAPMAILATTFVSTGAFGLMLRFRVSATEDESDRETEKPNRSTSRWWSIILGIAAFLWFLPLLLQSLLPDSEWDGTAAHLPLAVKLVREGLWFADPEYFHHHNPANANLLYGLLLELRGEAALVPLNLAVAVGTAAVAFALARRLWGPCAGWWAMASVMATTLLWELGIDLRVDGFLAFAAALSTTAFVLWVVDRNRTGPLVSCAAFAGLCVGIKTNGLIPATAIGLAVAGTTLIDLKKRKTQVPAVIFGLVMALPSGIWYVRNAVEIGQPVYPIKPRVSEILYRDASGEVSDFSADFVGYLEHHLTREQRSALTQRTILGVDLFAPGVAHLRRPVANVWDLIRHPDRHTRKRLHWISPVLFVGLLLPLLQRDRGSFWLWLITLVSALMVGWLTYIVRYALFLVPLLAVAAAGVLSRIRWRPLRWVLAAVLIGQTGLTAAAEWQKLVAHRPLQMFRGTSSRLVWLSEVGYSGAPGMARLTLLLNRMVRDGRLGTSDAIFMVGEGKGIHLACRHIPDPGFDCTPWLAQLVRSGGDLDDMATALRERGVRLLVVNHGFLSWCLRESVSDVEAVAVALESLDRFLDRHARYVTTEAWIDLYELRPSDQPEETRRERNVEPEH